MSVPNQNLPSPEISVPTAVPDGAGGRGRAILAFVLSAVVIAGSDLWTKEVIFDLLQVQTVVRDDKPVVVHQQRVKLLENFFWLEANYNTGAFSGWFSRHTGWLAVVSGLALLVIAAIFVYHLRSAPRPDLMLSLALGLLWGGTLGNLYDRATLNGVRDWIRWFVVIGGDEKVWPNFNIADAGICTGVGLLLLRELLVWRRERAAARAA